MQGCVNKKDLIRIKKYNVKQMNNYCSSIYRSGVHDGVEASTKADVKILLHQILKNTKGIGPVLTERILSNLKG